MDRNREARRTPVSTSNGVSRRRHRGSSFRDSPEEDIIPMEFHEASKPRDRSILKKDRDRDRDRVRDRDRDRCSRSKRRRGDRQIHGSGREDVGGDESTDDSVNDFEEFDEDDYPAAHLRLIPHPRLPVLMNNHQRKSFSPAKDYRTTQAWKNTDEMIGFSVPRKARSASTKRSHECWTGGAGAAQSSSPARPAVVGSSPAAVSPSSSNASARKKTKNIGAKNRGPKSLSKSPPSSNQDEIEFEIAEVLYGLRQNHSAKGELETTMIDLVKFDCRDSPISSNYNAKISSRASSPPLSVVAPKRKKPRQPKCEEEYPPPLLSSERVSSTKLDGEELQKPGPCSSPLTEKTTGSENGGHIPAVEQVNPESCTLSESKPGAGTCNQAVDNDAMSMADAEAPIKKESDADSSKENRSGFAGVEDDQEVGKIQFLIDLMAPPLQIKGSPERVGICSPPAVKKPSTCEESNVESKPLTPSCDDPMEETVKISLDIGPDMEKRGGKIEQRDAQMEKEKQQLNHKPHLHLKPCREQRGTEITAATWPSGVPPVGYMGGGISTESSNASSAAAAVQPHSALFSHPRPKRCATHCYIASSISSHEKLVRMNTFWSPPAPPPLYSKPSSVAGVPAPEISGNGPTVKGNPHSQDKGGPALCVFPAKDKPPQGSSYGESAPRTPQILLQQAPANILGPAFLFPLNQQQQGTAGAAPPRPAGKSASANHNQTPSGTSVVCSPPPAVSMSFSYPNIPPNEAQYLTILQNNPYPFAVPPYRGGAHPQVVPFFNAPFYSSQMLHPQKNPPPPPHQRPPSSAGFPPPKTHPRSSQHGGPVIRQLDADPCREDSPSTADSRTHRPGPYPQSFEKRQKQQQHGPAVSFSADQSHPMLPEMGRHGYQVGGPASHLRKTPRPGGPEDGDEEEKKVKSIAFSRPDPAETPNPGAVDLSSRTTAPRLPSPSVPPANPHRQLLHLQKQPPGAGQRGKIPTGGGGGAYSDHLPPPSIAMKFPNSVLPPNLIPGPSPQWKSTAAAMGKPASSSSSSPQMKSTAAPPPPQHRGACGGGHTQISFGSGPKAGASPSPSPPSLVAAAANLSKGNGGTHHHVPAGKTAPTGCHISKAPPPSAGGRLASALSSGCGAAAAGKPGHHELSKQAWHQAQLFFSAPAQTQSAPSGVYFGQRRRSEQVGPASSQAVLSLSSPGTAASDPAKVGSSKGGGGGGGGGLHPPAQFSMAAVQNVMAAGFPHVHALPAPAVKQPVEQKQQPAAGE